MTIITSADLGDPDDRDEPEPRVEKLPAVESQSAKCPVCRRDLVAIFVVGGWGWRCGCSNLKAWIDKQRRKG